MDQSTQVQKTPGSSSKSLIIVISVAAVVIVAAIAVAVVVILRNIQTDDKQVIGYATEAKVMLDKNELQAAMDEAVKNAAEGRVGLSYKNDAFSDDGINFECYIANSKANVYDMFLTISTDAELKDQVFLSELVPPGSGFEQIALDRALDVGDHVVYVTLTQVKLNDEGEQVMCNQITHTMDFHVSRGSSSTSQ